MAQKIKQYILRFGLAGLLLAPVVAPGAAYAQGAELPGTICSGSETLQINSAGGGTCDNAGAEQTVNNLITTVINIFSAIVGIVAVIMILFGGFKYITAGGDSSKITSAQHTIIYAIIGLIIVALAQIVVRFVLSRAVGSTA